MKHYINIIAITIFTLFGCLFSGCGERDIEPAMSAAPGGGTLSEYLAYNLDSIPGISDIYGKVVFWESNQGYTLVQISLYNTLEGTEYPTALYSSEIGSGAVVENMYTIDGADGEFSTSKFYVINDQAFFDNLPAYDGHVSIMAANGSTIVATGNIGVNVPTE